MSDFHFYTMSRLQHTHQFVGRKIRRVRWQKVPQTSSITSVDLPEKFATASCDEGLQTKNEVVVWHLTAEEIGVDTLKRQRRGGAIEAMVEDDDRYSLTNMPDMDWKFVRSAAMEVDSDIHEMQFINEDHIVFGTANGDLIIAQWSRADRSIRPIKIFKEVHGKNISCVGFSLIGNEIVSLGSNGTVISFDIGSLSEQRSSIESLDTHGGGFLSSMTLGPLLCIEHIGANEVVTGNAAGQLQLWDLRQRPQPRQQLPSTISNAGAVTALRSHPSQRHVVVAGYQAGNVAFWDLRSSTLALTATFEDIHSGPIWEFQFHPIYPAHLYSASNDGRILHWDASGVKLLGDNFGVSPWSLSTEQLRDQVKLTSLISENTMPVNSLDVVGDMLLAGADDESVWMIKNLPVS